MYSDTYDRDLVHHNRTFYYGPPQEVRDHGQYPSPVHFDAYLPDSYPITVVSSLDPGGIFGPRTQYLSHLEQPFVGTFPPGNPEFGPSFPISQQVLAQTTSQPIGSAPCGNPTPPGSFSARLLPPAYSSAPSPFLPHDHQLVMFSVLPRRVDNQPQPVSASVIGPAGHVQSPRTTPMRRRNRLSASPANAHPRPSKPKPPVQWYCPVSGCGVPSGRPQERNRHLQSHLPCSIACSFGPCLWRGDRFDTFTKHLCHKHQTNEPDGHGYRLYDPRPLVDEIVKGSISIEDATQLAIEKVEEMALQIGKLEFLDDPSGPKRKTGSR
ncbi:hypothetical protein EDB85DRAFT_1576934 [Lactarius pseudohatsudake]|nr:hypothetical protein EDB85DRAFT_1576934 [Lactarius pseudohatsudake]